MCVRHDTARHCITSTGRCPLIHIASRRTPRTAVQCFRPSHPALCCVATLRTHRLRCVCLHASASLVGCRSQPNDILKSHHSWLHDQQLDEDVRGLAAVRPAALRQPHQHGAPAHSSAAVPLADAAPHRPSTRVWTPKWPVPYGRGSHNHVTTSSPPPQFYATAPNVRCCCGPLAAGGSRHTPPPPTYFAAVCCSLLEVAGTP